MEFRGLDQREFARKMGLTQASVSSWLNGATPRPSTRTKIAQALDIKKEQIYMHPLAETGALPARTTSQSSLPDEPRRLEDWVTNPNATVDGVPMKMPSRLLVLGYARELMGEKQRVKKVAA